MTQQQQFQFCLESSLYVIRVVLTLISILVLTVFFNCLPKRVLFLSLMFFTFTFHGLQGKKKVFLSRRQSFRLDLIIKKSCNLLQSVRWFVCEPRGCLFRFWFHGHYHTCFTCRNHILHSASRAGLWVLQRLRLHIFPIKEGIRNYLFLFLVHELKAANALNLYFFPYLQICHSWYAPFIELMLSCYKLLSCGSLAGVCSVLAWDTEMCQKIFKPVLCSFGLRWFIIIQNLFILSIIRHLKL